MQPTTLSIGDAVDTIELDVVKKVADLEAENAKLQESKDRMMELLKKQKNKIQKLTAEKEQAVTEATNANQKATAGTTTVAAVSFSSLSSTPSGDIRLGSNGAPSTPKAALQPDAASSMATNTVTAATNDAPSVPPLPSVSGKGGRKRGRGAKKAAAAAGGSLCGRK